jgi:hypothetical protein
VQPAGVHVGVPLLVLHAKVHTLASGAASGAPVSGAVPPSVTPPQVPCVSQPLVLGAVVEQSAHPTAQPVKWHVVPSQVAPTLCWVSQTRPHAPQLVMLVVHDSHPSVSGAPLLQSR